MVDLRGGVRGMEQVKSNLSKQLKAVEGRTIAGLMEAGYVVQRESDLHVPREYGFLVNSHYVRKSQSKDLVVEVGYSASYAIYVHENLEMKLAGKPRPSGLGVYWGPAGHSKFLERAAREKLGEIISIVRRRAQTR